MYPALYPYVAGYVTVMMHVNYKSSPGTLLIGLHGDVYKTYFYQCSTRSKSLINTVLDD